MTAAPQTRPCIIAIKQGRPAMGDMDTAGGTTALGEAQWLPHLLVVPVYQQDIGLVG